MQHTQTCISQLLWTLTTNQAAATTSCRRVITQRPGSGQTVSTGFKIWGWHGGSVNSTVASQRKVQMPVEAEGVSVWCFAHCCTGLCLKMSTFRTDRRFTGMSIKLVKPLGIKQIHWWINNWRNSSRANTSLKKLKVNKYLDVLYQGNNTTGCVWNHPLIHYFQLTV